MGYVLKKSEEYLNGFHRYYAQKRAPGRPSPDEKLPLIDDINIVLNPLPCIGDKIMLYDTYTYSDLPGSTLYDRYETDISGTPIIYSVKEITADKVILERTIETYNENITLNRMVPARWFTCGHCGWIKQQEFYERGGDHEEEH